MISRITYISYEQSLLISAEFSPMLRLVHTQNEQLHLLEPLFDFSAINISYLPITVSYVFLTVFTI
jgi:hypothetical protein